MHLNILRFATTACGVATLVLLVGCGSGSDGDGYRPTADSLTVGEGGTVTTTAAGAASLLANDLGVDAEVSVDPTPAAAPQHGAVELHADGTFRYTHDGSETVEDSFAYAALVGGRRVEQSVSVTVDPLDDPPQVANDSYSGALGNTWLTLGVVVPGASVDLVGSVLDNDVDPDGDLTVVDWDTESSAGGAVHFEANGRFSYLPPTGFTGDDTFDYQASDGKDTRAGTVTVSVSGMAWYVDGDQAGDGDGSAARPFTTVSQLAGESRVGTGHAIYLYAANDAYTGPIELQPDQVLAGEGARFTFGALDLAAGDPPVIRNNAGSAVFMAPGARVQGLTIGDTTGVGLHAAKVLDGVATFGGQVTVRDVSVTGYGPAFVADYGVELDVEFDSLSCQVGGDEFGVALRDCSGRFVVKGETVIHSARDAGLEIGPSSIVESTVSGGPCAARVEFRDLVTLVNCGDSTQPEWATAALWVVNTTDSVSFADVVIQSRQNIGVGLRDTSGDVAFRDVDVFNESGLQGAAVIAVNCAAAVSFASIDATDFIPWDNSWGPGGTLLNGAVVAHWYAESNGEFVSEDFDFQVTGDGPQGDGGAVTGAQGPGVLGDSFGSLALHAMRFEDLPIGVEIRGGFRSASLSDCTFARWSPDDPTAPMPGLYLRLGEHTSVVEGVVSSGQVQVTGCTFDASKSTAQAPAVGIYGSDGEDEFIHVDLGAAATQSGVERGNVFSDVQGDAILLDPGDGLLRCDVVANAVSWLQPGSGSAGHAVRGHSGGSGRMSLGVSDCTLSGPGAGLLRLTTQDAIGTQTLSTAPRWLYASVENNQVTGTAALADLNEAGAAAWHVNFAGNVASGLTDRGVVAEFDAEQPTDAQTMLRMAGNDLAFAAGYAGRNTGSGAGAATHIGLDGPARIEIRGDDYFGVEGLSTLPTIHIEVLNGSTDERHVTLADNTYDRTSLAPFAQLLMDSAGRYLADVTGHTSGVFQARRNSGELSIESRADFATNNPGAALADMNLATTSVPADTVQAPEGPWR